MNIKNVGKLTAQLLSLLVLATACSVNAPEGANSSGVSDDPVASADVAVAANPCAAADPCAADPCAANPCAAADPCAAVAADPCAGQSAAVDATDTQAVRYFVGDNGLAIHGTDPVAYFTEGGPVAGSSEYVYTWNDATWQFTSAENRDLFAANPEQYAPQYGGFCAWAVSQGYTASIDPDAWSIVDDKLYLNYSKGVQRRWERDIPGNISQANANWPGVLSDS